MKKNLMANLVVDVNNGILSKNAMLLVKLENGTVLLHRGDNSFFIEEDEKEHVIEFLSNCESYETKNVESDFVILDCGGYKLMVSNWKGDSSNYDDKWVTWYDSQSWVDEYCNKTNLGGFSDWVVPTKDELNLIYENKSKFTGKDKFTANLYWSSSEYSTTSAWRQYFLNGNQSYGTKAVSSRVRGVRRITL